MHIETDSKSCCGCTACMSVCPANAIKMISDSEGFYIPQTDGKNCIECGACVRVCPTEKKTSEEHDSGRLIQAFAAKYVNDIRSDSASGGLFPALAKYVLENKNGWVCGCVLNQESLMPEHIVSNNWLDVQRMQDSKYVQSNMQDCYSRIGELLKKNQMVLFSGTSCQIAGLYSFLDAKRIRKDSLMTVDFFCHGVPSPQIWKEYLSFYKKKKKRTPIGYRFRSKKYGWGSSRR